MHYPFGYDGGGLRRDDAVAEIGKEPHAEFGGGGGQSLEGIPRPCPVPGLRAETDIAFAHAASCRQFHIILVPGKVGMFQHRQQLGPFVGGFADPVIQRRIAGLFVHQGVKRIRQPCTFRFSGRLLIGQQVAIERPRAFPNRGAFRRMMVHPWGKLGGMPPLMHPPPGVGGREMVRHGGIIAQQPAQDGRLGLGVIGGTCQCIADRLYLLLRERDPDGGQVLLACRRRHGRVAGPGVPQLAKQGVRQAARLPPRQRLVPEAIAEFLAPDDRQDIPAHAFGMGMIAREPGIAHHGGRPRSAHPRGYGSGRWRPTTRWRGRADESRQLRPPSVPSDPAACVPPDPCQSADRHPAASAAARAA